MLKQHDLIGVQPIGRLRRLGLDPLQQVRQLLPLVGVIQRSSQKTEKIVR